MKETSKQDPGKVSEVFSKVEKELAEGMSLKKCLQCGCMKEELEQTLLVPQAPAGLKVKASNWLKEMQPIRYACLGCDYCYPAVAASVLATSFPQQIQGPLCAMNEKAESWPYVAGDYFVLDYAASVAISTLGSVELAEAIAKIKPAGVCIVGKTETENIGIDKIIKNTITNPGISRILLVGKDLRGHLPGATLVALSENGIDENSRIINSPARRPFLRNVSTDEIAAFRKQVTILNHIGVDTLEGVERIISDIAIVGPKSSVCCSFDSRLSKERLSGIQEIAAKDPDEIVLDKAGYFVIFVDQNRWEILVEHYSYKDRLLRNIRGKNARMIYWTLIKNGWVTELTHAAYLGKELAKAELSLELQRPYVQDGA